MRVEGRPEHVSGEAGSVLLREVIERSGLLPWLTKRLEDPRDAERTTHSLTELLLTTLLLLALGWRDRDDADTLRHDPLLRMSTSERRGLGPLEQRPQAPGQVLPRNPQVPDGLASQPTLSRLVHMLSSDAHRQQLRAALLEGTVRRLRAQNKGAPLESVTVDMDSIPLPVQGHQPGSEYNGHYHERMFHALVCSLGETGDLLDAKLRPGNVHSAQGGLEFVLPLLDQLEQRLCRVAAVRVDAGFPSEPFLRGLEQRALPTPYVARIKNNAALDRLAAPFLQQPPGSFSLTPRTWFHELSYQAQSWSVPRRVVLVVQELPGQLLPHHFCLLTNLTCDQMSGPELLQWYRQRGRAEGSQGEFKSVLNPALSSSPRPKRHYRGKCPATRSPAGDSFARNEAWLLLSLLAYHFLHTARVFLEQATQQGWSLQRLRERVLRVPARLLLHGRRALVVLGQAAAVWWQALWARLSRWQPSPAS
jgi:hypothetical protein